MYFGVMFEELYEAFRLKLMKKQIIGLHEEAWRVVGPYMGKLMLIIANCDKHKALTAWPVGLHHAIIYSEYQ